MSEALPPRVQRFIAAHIDSIEKLEVLLLLRAHADRAWTPAAVSQELRIAETSAARRLMDLAARGLLAVEGGSPAAYRYGPEDAEDAVTVDELAESYGTRRVSVITFIFSRPLDTVRGFADAFRLKKDKEDEHG